METYLLPQKDQRAYRSMSRTAIVRIATESSDLTEAEVDENVEWVQRDTLFDAQLQRYMDQPLNTGEIRIIKPLPWWGGGARPKLPPYLPRMASGAKPGRPKKPPSQKILIRLELPLVAKFLADCEGKIPVEEYVLNVLRSIGESLPEVRKSLTETSEAA